MEQQTTQEKITELTNILVWLNQKIAWHEGIISESKGLKKFTNRKLIKEAQTTINCHRKTREAFLEELADLHTNS